MLMVTNSTVAKILKTFIQDYRACTSQWTISAYAMYYSEFAQKVSSFITVLLAVSLPPDKVFH